MAGDIAMQNFMMNMLREGGGSSAPGNMGGGGGTIPGFLKDRDFYSELQKKSAAALGESLYKLTAAMNSGGTLSPQVLGLLSQSTQLPGASSILPPSILRLISKRQR